MAKQLTIIGSISEKDDIEVLCSKLQEIGIEPRILYPASDYMSKGPAVCAPVAILWISSKSDEQVFKTANDRNAKGNTTINYFADAVTLSDSQKGVVGRNRSVFALVQPNNSVDEVLSLIDFDLLSSPSKSMHPTEKSVVERSEKKETLNEDKQGTAFINKASVSSSEDVNNHVQNSEEVILPEEAPNGNKIVWMPLVWYVVNTLYDYLTTEGIITVWSDQTFLWITLIVLEFVLAYKIGSSTIAAIKRSKWCYLYIPLSLFIMGSDIVNGFRLLSKLF